MWDDDVNPAIDDVARQMTEGSPDGGADVRRRVLARIAAGEAPRRSWRAAFVLSPIAVAASIIIAMFVARGVPGRHPGAEPQHHGAEHAPALLQRERESARTAPAAGVEVVRPVAVVASRVPSPPARDSVGAELAPPETEAPLDPIAIAPLVVDVMTPDSIQIQRLDTITPITVAPIDITDAQRRDP